MKYRPEIDGLRALAVLPVVLFHAGFSVFSGGYVGVDVFFVISGYLITTILMNDLAAGNFSILRFYERRARRILPALVVVIFACLPFAWMWMLPAEFRNFGQSIVAVSLFASNILFWLESGYFSTDAEAKPLLHTWSLAVEEQYYLLFPVFLFFMWRYGHGRIFLALIVMSIMSFSLCEWAWRHWPEANFYLTPMRAWELFAGSIAAMIVLRQGVRAHDGMAGVGLIGIVVSVFLFDTQTPFPSVYTGLPVVGVVLIILFGGSGTLTARVLSHRILVGIGLISYSLYLWHQPLFAFAKMRSLHAPDMGMMMVLCVCALGLAYVTWRFVEQPFRGASGFMVRQRDVLASGGLVLVVLGGIGMWAHFQNDANGRLPNHVIAIMAAKGGDSSGCHNHLTPQSIAQGDACVIGRMDQTPKIAIIGDSHASRITDAIAQELDDGGASAVTYNASWCAPLMRFGTDALFKNGCRPFVDAAFEQVLKNQGIETVILFSEWSNYTKGGRLGDDVLAKYVFNNQGDVGNVAAFEDAVEYTFSQLKQSGKDVIIISPTPEYQFHVPQLMAKVALFNQSTRKIPAMTKAGYLNRNGDAILALNKNADRFGFSVLNAFEVFCAAQECMLHTEKFEALYEDSNHLNFAGANMLAVPLMEMVARSSE